MLKGLSNACLNPLVFIIKKGNKVMWKKIILAVLIAILVLLIYIGILWFVSLDSIVDKDGMIHRDYNKNVINENLESS